MKKQKSNFLQAISSWIVLSIIVIAVSTYFVFNSAWIGPAFIGLGIISLIFLGFFGLNY